MAQKGQPPAPSPPMVSRQVRKSPRSHCSGFKGISSQSSRLLGKGIPKPRPSDWARWGHQACGSLELEVG